LLDGARILICEDEPFVAIDLAMSVQEAGGQVLGPAGSVSEAMSLLARHPVNGAILDVNLSDGDVTPVAERLLERNVPIILQTGVGIPSELRQRYPDLTALSKPVIAQQLVERIGRLLATG
jgi:DNA-binding response OmpR family regulator